MASPSPPPPISTTFTGSEFYPEEAWISLSLFLVVIGLFQWGSTLYSKVARRRRRPRKGADEESTHTSPRPGPEWSVARLPIAAVNVFRVVAFRWTLEFGTYDLKVAEVFLTLSYVAFLLMWTFVGGEFIQKHDSHVITSFIFWTFADEELEVTKPNINRWSGRAGVLAASQFPLVTALGTKNNIVSRG